MIVTRIEIYYIKKSIDLLYKKDVLYKKEYSRPKVEEKLKKVHLANRKTHPLGTFFFLYLAFLCSIKMFSVYKVILFFLVKGVGCSACLCFDINLHQ